MDGISIDLRGRLVIVSGAGGGGIGTAMVQSIARAGATVLAVDISQASLDRDVTPLIEQGLDIVPMLADVQEAEGVDKVMRHVCESSGRLHGLVTVVGGAHANAWKSALEVTRADWDTLQSWNLASMFFMAQAVAAELRRQGGGGSIVALSSISGLGAAPFHVSYGAAKAGVLSIVRTLALELAGSGIRVNALAPGAVATPGSLVSPADSELRSAIPLGRVASGAEIAGAALFLLSDLASYVTGQCLVADGGTSLRWSHLDENNTPKLVDNEAFKQRLIG